MDNLDFEEQLALEARERTAAEDQSDPYTHVDPNDGTVYEWNHDKQAWFPKITDDFIASYQANYGNFEGMQTSEPPAVTSVDITDKTEPVQKPKPGEKRKPQEPAWFDMEDTHNTKVYVSGLPPTITDDEFIELMAKCGMVMKDLNTNKYKCKLYKNADGTLKGDGLCCYIKIESVDLALNILDGYRYKDHEIHIERAKFQMKGDYDPSKKPRKKKAKEKEKLKKKMEKLFDWRPEKLRGQRLRHEKTVVIKNMFDPKEFEKDPRTILEYQQDIREECAKCGEVKKVVVYDRNPEGVATVSFREAEEADECINLMNRRWFAGRQLTAETWDGKTRYKIEESEAELEKRISQWDKFLEADDDAGPMTAGTSENNTVCEKDNTNKSIDAETSEATMSKSSDAEIVSNNKGSKKEVPESNGKKRKATEDDTDVVGACATDEERHSDQDSEESDTDEKRWP